MTQSTAFDSAGVTHLTFDCYGTLVDWESGILEQAQTALAASGAGEIEPVRLLKSYVKHELEIESGPSFVPYRTVLSEIMGRIGLDFGVHIEPARCAEFASGMGAWPLFADTQGALERLASRFSLVILSNVDDDLFALTAPRLGVNFAAVITAQQVQSYKPRLGHFHKARDLLGLGPHNWVHVAQSLYHDHVPAKSLGLRTLWVDRPSRLAGFGLSPAIDADYDARTTSLAEVASLLGV